VPLSRETQPITGALIVDHHYRPGHRSLANRTSLFQPTAVAEAWLKANNLL
jgi:hypothetical protein